MSWAGVRVICRPILKRNTDFAQQKRQELLEMGSTSYGDDQGERGRRILKGCSISGRYCDERLEGQERGVVYIKICGTRVSDGGFMQLGKI